MLFNLFLVSLLFYFNVFLLIF